MADGGYLEATYGLAGRTALVTGGGSGIGLAIATSLSRAGARVVLAGRRVEVLEAARDGLPWNTLCAPMDLAEIGGIEATWRALSDEAGHVDILVNNAGNTIKKPFAESDMEDFDAVMDVHVRGAVELTRHFVRQDFGERGGSVIFTSSMTAFIGQPMVLGYTTAKTAISGLVRGLSAELAERGIRVNAVAPGWIDTALYRKATEGDLPRQQKILGRIPMARLGEASEIGTVCAFLASPAASYVTGQILPVDGGGATGF